MVSWIIILSSFGTGLSKRRLAPLHRAIPTHNNCACYVMWWEFPIGRAYQSRWICLWTKWIISCRMNREILEWLIWGFIGLKWKAFDIFFIIWLKRDKISQIIAGLKWKAFKFSYHNWKSINLVKVKCFNLNHARKKIVWQVIEYGAVRKWRHKGFWLFTTPLSLYHSRTNQNSVIITKIAKLPPSPSTKDHNIICEQPPTWHIERCWIKTCPLYTRFFFSLDFVTWPWPKRWNWNRFRFFFFFHPKQRSPNICSSLSGIFTATHWRMLC